MEHLVVAHRLDLGHATCILFDAARIGTLWVDIAVIELSAAELLNVPLLLFQIHSACLTSTVGRQTALKVTCQRTHRKRILPSLLQQAIFFSHFATFLFFLGALLFLDQDFVTRAH